MTIGLAVALRAAADRLRAAGVQPARVQAELLAAHVLGVQRGGLFGIHELTDTQDAALDVLLQRRAAGVPLQHLLGTAPFRHLELAVGPGVFIPRPETELILEIAQSQLAEANLVIDLCSGSGAIAISVATEFPGVRVVAVERSPAALDWLAGNVAAHAPSVHVLHADVADQRLLGDLAGAADVVLANPPYVPDDLKPELPAEIAHDPDEAVFAGADGLDVITAVVSAAARLLRPGGMLVLEHDESHQPAVLALLGSDLPGPDRWIDPRGHPDLTGRPRFVSAVRQDAEHE